MLTDSAFKARLNRMFYLSVAFSKVLHISNIQNTVSGPGGKFLTNDVDVRCELDLERV